MFRDLSYSARMLLKNRVFTAMAVLSLALGIGANAAIFSLLDAVLLKMLPVRQPQQLMFLESGDPGFKRSSNISYAALEHLRKQNQVLSDLCFFSYTTRLNASINGQVEVVEGQPVSGNFFSVLGVDAIAGRILAETDDVQNSAQPVAVISYRYWQRRFGQSPLVVGQTATLNSTPVTIVGVTPPEFFGVIVGNAPDIFIPSITADRILPRRFGFRGGSLPFVLGRLRPGVSEPQANAALTLLLQQANLADAGTQLTSEKQQAIQRQPLKLIPASQGFNLLRVQFSKPLKLLMVVVGLVLLIACANVANLLLARATTRKKEIALRLALGASRLRIVRQLLTESVLLALIGGGLGLLLASWGSNLLLTVVSSGRNPVTSNANLTINVPLDFRILGFTAIVSMLAAIVFGLAPAWRATRLDLSPTLKDNARGGAVSGRFLWGRSLVVAQVALSLMLLVGAGLFIRSLSKLRNFDVGFKRDNVLLFSVDPQLIRYQQPQIATLYKQMLERVATVPDVQSVSLARQGLLSGSGTQGSIKVPGRPSPADENRLTQTGNNTELNAPYFSQVGPNFFATLGMTLVQGRDFARQDNETAPRVAVVNETFARYYFSGGDALGKRFDRGPDNGGEVEIIGVVKDAKSASIREQTPRAFYVPFLQDPSSWRETTFQVRTNGDPLNVIAAIRREVQAIEPNLPLFRVRTLDDQVNESLGQDRLVTTLASLFGILALLLACAGLYGVLSYFVNQRTHEIGIRMALGAGRVDVLKMIFKQGMTLALIGIVVGLSGAYILTRYLESLTTMLFGVRPTDPFTFAVTALVLTAVAMLACYLPARRATRVDPLVALKYE